MVAARHYMLAFPRGLIAVRLALLVPALVSRALCAQPIVAHEINVSLDPAGGAIEVVDRISLPEALLGGSRVIEFTLNSAFEPELLSSEITLLRLQDSSEDARIARYQLRLPAASRDFELRYSGRLAGGKSYGAGHIGPEGVYLSGAGAWYPDFESAFLSVSMTVQLPPGWTAVSQGQRQPPLPASNATQVRWVENQAQDELYLIAAPFHVLARDGEIAQAQAYLRAPDEALAARYFDVTEHYLSLYSRLIGPYAYEKFALVENFWESGLGMPSFTLLGPRVIRLPFILHTAYPHEILHNWWGNGVYVDYAHGNWSEGLTAYLADHLTRELRGEGALYRREALQKYRNYVLDTQDFPLREFVGRHSEASAAIGYNKALMFFHMLRRRLGDRTFIDGLRGFYEKHRFTRASYDDLRRALEGVAGESLGEVFAQWVDRSGAPMLSLSGVRAAQNDQGFKITGSLQQTQAGQVYHLWVPVVVQTVEASVRAELEMTGRHLAIDIDVPARPLTVLVDPEFDLFRRLHLEEIPATLGELLGSAKTVAVLPEAAPDEVREAYRFFAHKLGVDDILTDAELETLPEDRPVWVLGWRNLFREEASTSLGRYQAGLSDRTASFEGQSSVRGQECLVLVARRPSSGEPLAWLGCEAGEAMQHLVRKLPHYGKYSYLSFEGGAMSNRLKGSWQNVDSPLHVRLVPEGEAPRLELPARGALVEP